MLRVNVFVVPFAQRKFHCAYHTSDVPHGNFCEAVVLRLVFGGVFDVPCFTRLSAPAWRFASVIAGSLAEREKDGLRGSCCCKCPHQRWHTPKMACALACTGAHHLVSLVYQNRDRHRRKSICLFTKCFPILEVPVVTMPGDVLVFLASVTASASTCSPARARRQDWYST